MNYYLYEGILAEVYTQGVKHFNFMPETEESFRFRVKERSQTQLNKINKMAHKYGYRLRGITERDNEVILSYRKFKQTDLSEIHKWEKEDKKQ